MKKAVKRICGYYVRDKKLFAQNRKKVQELREEGLTQREIAKKMGWKSHSSVKAYLKPKRTRFHFSVEQTTALVSVFQRAGKLSKEEEEVYHVIMRKRYNGE